MAVKPIPDGANNVIPHLTIDGGQAKKAVEFYVKAFNAEAGSVATAPGGDMVLHAELKIGNSQIYLADSFGPPSGSPNGITLNLWVNNADEAWERAKKAGCTVHMEIGDQFWGDRYGQLKDPFGHTWAISQHVKDVTPEEMGKAAAEWFQSQG